MDSIALHAATEELAGVLSELTVGDLDAVLGDGPETAGELYQRISARCTAAATALGVEPDVPDGTAASVDWYGGGLDLEYRRVAGAVERALAAEPDPGRRITVDGHEADLDTLRADLIDETRAAARALEAGLGFG